MIANIWAIAVMVVLGYPLSILTIVVPALIQTIGFAYVIHMVSEYRDLLRQGQAEGGAAPMALRQLALPLVLTALTTAAGLGALSLSRMVAVQEFGILAVIGVVCTLAATVIFAPAALQIGRQRTHSSGGDDGFDRIAERLAAFDLRHRRSIFAGAALILAISVFGMTRIQVSSHFASNFPSDHPVRSDYENINQNLDGGGLFSVVLQTEEPDGFKEPSNLRTVEAIQSWLQEQPEVGSTTSLADYVKVINWGFRGNDPDERRIPESRQLVSQLMLVGENDELDQFVDTYFQTANILVRTTVLTSAEVSDLVDRIEARLADLPEGMTGRPTGSLPLLSNTVDEIARGQALSLSVAFIAIYLVLTVLFTSMGIGFIALIPNALPVIFYFGLLGLTGVTLNATTGLVACLALGIAVDDTIHYFTRFSREARRLASEEQATFSALRVVGRPVTVTSLALCLGFLVLMISGLRSLVEFGVMTSATLAFAWLSDVLLTPALCSGLRIVTLWDTLTLDLGKDPTREIPLFRGLTHRQARIVCLLASIRSFAAGQRVFRKGDPAKEMYVVIDGELRASLSRPTGRIELSPHRRGDALGEVGLYYGKRTADVDAVTQVRALRLTRRSIDRLVRRSPRIGAIVCRNLIDVLADRTASATDRITEPDSSAANP
jgi:predicted RND superfamily exporter protein